ncbi:Hypothetical predicted protein [Paramuricea clavata]|uniref:Uncharacterized protein n=1 Tax=Paramuricea clavata TaxID=317549 RepID=A0A7D9JFI5_PARCT|nr:Hypothetical predicted protein [Paramuricea clavata]
MYLKNFSTNVVLTAILFIMVHVNKSVARMEKSKNLMEFLKYDDETISWLKQKRTPHKYNDPCMHKTENFVTTRSLDKSNCPLGTTCMYIPSQLKEIKCKMTSNPLNVRNKTSCGHGISGDCLDIVATITVMKIFNTTGRRQHVERNVSLNVGCACMLLSV